MGTLLLDVGRRDMMEYQPLLGDFLCCGEVAHGGLGYQTAVWRCTNENSIDSSHCYDPGLAYHE